MGKKGLIWRLLLIGAGLTMILNGLNLPLLGEKEFAAGFTDVRTELTPLSPVTLPSVSEEGASSPETTNPVASATSAEATDEVLWPNIGQPVKLSISGVVTCEVYNHTPEDSPDGVFSPNPGKVGWWTGSTYSLPGTQGYSLLAAHVTDCFAQLAQTAIIGTEVLVEDSDGNVIVLAVTEEAVRYHKRQIPWEEVIRGNVSDDQSVTWLFTCGGEERRDDGHRVYNDLVRTELVRVHNADGEVIFTPPPSEDGVDTPVGYE